MNSVVFLFSRSFYVWFCQFVCDVPGYGFWFFSFMEFAVPSRPAINIILCKCIYYVVHQTLEVFSYYFFKLFFFQSFSSSFGTLMTWILDFLVLSLRSVKLFTFYTFFSLLFRLDSFYWCIFKFTHSSFGPLHSTKTLQ